jgi:hypothetical protein
VPLGHGRRSILHFSPAFVAKRQIGPWMQGLRPFDNLRASRGHRRRIQGDTVRRPTERNEADAVLSTDAADSR